MQRSERLAAIARTLAGQEPGRVVDLVEAAVGDGLSPDDVVRDGLADGLRALAARHDRHEIHLPELLLAVDAVRRALRRLPVAPATVGTVVLGVVEGDVHQVGKDLVGALLAAEGWRVVDLGADVPAARFADAVIAEQAGVLALSTMMTTTLPAMQRTIALARSLPSPPRIVVGGAPLTDAVARRLGADAYGEHAAVAGRRMLARE